MDDLQSEILWQTSPNELPEEFIIDEIFKRLPVKTLVRFKCLSKRWKSIISSPQFAKLHLHFQRSLADSKLCYLIIEHNYNEPTFFSFDYTRYDNGEIVPSLSGSDSGSKIYDTPETKEGLVKIEHGTDFREHLVSRELFDLVGCCDGLVCLALEYKVFLWNPATRELHKIPNPPSFVEDATTWAFGYVSSIDDYKILCYNSDYSPTKMEARTWALRHGKWGDIILHEGHCMQFRRYPSVIAYERVFWTVCTDCIVGFNLAEEIFEHVPVPPWMRVLENVHVFVMGRCLGVYGTGQGGMEIAMLKHYGDWDSWTKIYRFDSESFPDFWTKLCRCKSQEFVPGRWLRFIKTGKFLLCNNSGESNMVLDTNQNPPIYVEFLRLRGIQMEPYFESLMSPFT